MVYQSSNLFLINATGYFMGADGSYFSGYLGENMRVFLNVYTVYKDCFYNSSVLSFKTAVMNLVKIRKLIHI